MFFHTKFNIHLIHSTNKAEKYATVPPNSLRGSGQRSACRPESTSRFSSPSKTTRVSHDRSWSVQHVRRVSLPYRLHEVPVTICRARCLKTYRREEVPVRARGGRYTVATAVNLAASITWPSASPAGTAVAVAAISCPSGGMIMFHAL